MYPKDQRKDHLCDSIFSLYFYYVLLWIKVAVTLGIFTTLGYLLIKAEVDRTLPAPIVIQPSIISAAKRRAGPRAYTIVI